MSLNYFKELTTTINQLVIITVYAVLALVQMWRAKKDPKVSTAYMWFVIVRHVVIFAALLFCSFLIFVSLSFLFILITCIDVGNFYEEKPEVKSHRYKIPGIKIHVPTKIGLQLFLFWAMDIIVWWLIMFFSELWPSQTLWHRIHF